MSRKTREPQTVRQVLGRLVLVQAIKFLIIWLISKAIQRSIEMTEEIDRKRYGLEMDRQRIEHESVLKGFGRIPQACSSHPCFEDAPMCPDMAGSTGERWCTEHCLHDHTLVDGMVR